MQRSARRALAGLALVLVVLPLVASGGAPASAGPADVLRVGTWNLHRFGHPSVPRSTEDLTRLAHHIASAGLHVLALQEVVVTRLGSLGEPRSYALDEVAAILEEEHGQMWAYWLHRGKGDLQLGFMWRSGVVDVKAAPFMGLSSKKVPVQLVNKKGKKKSIKADPFPHFPVIAHVGTGEGTTDFTIINLHLEEPAPVWGKGSFWESRRAACESVASWIDRMYSPEKAPAKKVEHKKVKHKNKGIKMPNAVLPGMLGGPAFKPSVLNPQHVALANVKDVLGHLDDDLVVLGTLNAPVEPERELEPLLDLGMHLAGDQTPTHSGGDVLSRVLLTVPMGEEHVLATSHVPAGQEFTVTPAPGKGMSPHHLVTLVVAIRADDD